MKRLYILVTAIYCFSLLDGQNKNDEFNCSTIIVGRKASYSGSVIVAHNEDDDGDQIVNFYKSPSRNYSSSDFMKLKEGAKVPRTAHSLGFFWMEMPGQDFSDSYINEKGVLITSNSTPSREQFGEITDGGIGYELRKIVAERAQSARQGVELAGSLIEKLGYNGLGRTYTIADRDEAWMISIVRGKHWIAKKVPDDEVAYIPNYYTIGEADFKNTSEIIASKDIVEYAIKRGWYKPERDGKFNFRKVYSSENNLTTIDNIGRMWVGISMLSGKKLKTEDEFPFSFKPPHKITLDDIMLVQINHYEGTYLDDSKGYTKGTPHNNKAQDICQSSQQLSFIVEFRKNIPWDIGGRIWIAPRRGCVNAYMPFYYGITEIPKSLTMDSPEKAFEMHFKRTKAIYNRVDSMSWWSFVAVAEYVDADFINRYPLRKIQKEELQRLYFNQADQFEKDFLNVFNEDQERARKMINEFENIILEKALSDNKSFLSK